MVRKINLKSKSFWKKVGIIALASVLLVGAIAGISALFRKAEETTKTINPTYSVGALDHSTGKYVETKSAIYTKDGFECQGLTTSLEFDATIKYQLYFYSEYDEFIHTTGTMSGVFYSTDVPIYAKYARIVIIPNEDENINWFEKIDYSNQLNVTVNKSQNFKTFGNDLFTLAEDFEEGYVPSYSDGKTPSEQEGSVVSSLIEVSDLKTVCLCVTNREDETPSSYSSLYMYDDSGELLSVVKCVDFDKTFVASTGKYYYSLKLSDNVGFVRIVFSTGHLSGIYLY